MRSLIATAVLAMILSAPVSAQYFGRNKVQYKNLQFEVLKTQHFQLYFYPEERAAVDDLAKMAERWYARLSKIFNYDLSTIQPIVVYASGMLAGITSGAKRRSNASAAWGRTRSLPERARSASPKP